MYFIFRLCRWTRLLILRLILSRNALVSNAIGFTSFGGVTYSTTAENITGLLALGSAGYVTCFQFCRLIDLFNHGKPAHNLCWNVDVDRLTFRGIATDGITTLLRITIQ